MLPRAQVQLPIGNRNHHLTPHNLAFHVSIRIIFVTVVPVLAVRLFRGQLLQPDLVVMMQPGFIIVDEYRSSYVHRIDKHKPVLNAFKMLGQMKGDVIPLTSDGAIPVDEILKQSIRERPDINGMAVTDGKAVKIMLWNYHDILVPAKPASVQMKIMLPADFGNKAQLVHYRIDDTHSNAYTKWLELGSPQNPTPEMIAQLKEAMQLQLLEPAKSIDVTNNQVILDFELPRTALSMIILQKPEA